MNPKNKALLAFFAFSFLGICFFLSFILPFFLSFFQAIISSCGWTLLFGFAYFLVPICNWTNTIFFCHSLCNSVLTLSDPTSNLVRQYDFPVPLWCRKTSDTVFVAFVCPLSEPVWCFSSCSTGFSQQTAQVVLFLILYVFLF
jgi:hypothetical protein